MNFKKAASIAAAAAALTALSIPAMADVSLYGSARTSAFWNSVTAKSISVAIPPQDIKDTNTDFDIHNQLNSRFGAIASNGDLSGKLEVGVNAAMGIRLFYGEYKTAFGKLRVGQDYTPYWVASAQTVLDDDGFNGFGSTYDGRQPQIKFTLNNGLYVAAIKSNVGAGAMTQVVGTAATPDTESLLPKLAVGYEGKFQAFTYGAGAMVQTYKLLNVTPVIANTAAKASAASKTKIQGFDKNVMSYLGYAHGKYVAGPADVTFNVGIGQNLQDAGFGAANTDGHFQPAVAVEKVAGVSADLKNTTSIEGFVQAGYQVIPMAKVNVGFGYSQDKNDFYKTAGVSSVTTDNRMSIFVNAPITVTKGLIVTPEFTYIDELDNFSYDKTKVASKGNVQYIYGAQIMYNF